MSQKTKSTKPTTPSLLNGITPLMIAASQGNLTTVQRLISEGADLDCVDTFGNTALIYAVSGGHHPVTACLLYNGADVEITRSNGTSVVYLAIAEGYDEIVPWLLNARFLTAARRGQAEILATLVEEVDINARSAKGWTALMLAAYYGYLDAVRVLLNADADATLRDKHGWSARKLAAYKGHTEIVNFLEQHLPQRQNVVRLPVAAASQSQAAA